ncbi:MAG: large conductance mechanosensitive channel protein MscL [Bdellovibrionia bacterium]
MKGFKQFLMRGNVIDLAVAVVIGAAFGTVISTFVKDLLTPLIAALGGQPDFSNLVFTLNGSQFRYGEFINAVIAFIIVAAVVYYLIVVPSAQLKRLADEEVVNTRQCPECLSSIPLQARRCAHCGEPVETVTSAKSA